MSFDSLVGSVNASQVSDQPYILIFQLTVVRLPKVQVRNILIERNKAFTIECMAFNASSIELRYQQQVVTKKSAVTDMSIELTIEKAEFSHEGTVICMAYSPTGNALVTGEVNILNPLGKLALSVYMWLVTVVYSKLNVRSASDRMLEMDIRPPTNVV